MKTYKGMQSICAINILFLFFVLFHKRHYRYFMLRLLCLSKYAAKGKLLTCNMHHCNMQPNHRNNRYRMRAPIFSQSKICLHKMAAM